MLKAKQKLLIWPEVRTRGEIIIIIIITHVLVVVTLSRKRCAALYIVSNES